MRTLSVESKRKGKGIMLGLKKKKKRKKKDEYPSLRKEKRINRKMGLA